MRYIQYLTEVILAWIQMKEGKNLPEKYHHLFETELSEEGEIREVYQNLLAEERSAENCWTVVLQDFCIRNFTSLQKSSGMESHWM